MLPCITRPPPSSTIMKPANTMSSDYSAEGTLYVSKPFRSKSAKRLRALITFKPRKSHFDTTNESSGSNEFRVGTSRIRAVVVTILTTFARGSSRSSGCLSSSSLFRLSFPPLKQTDMRCRSLLPPCSLAMPLSSHYLTPSSSLPLPFVCHLQRL